MSAERTITVLLFNVFEERTVAQCGPFSTQDEAVAFMAEHVDLCGPAERLRVGLLPTRATFVEILRDRAADREAGDRRG